jgi:hypothetical protein
LVTNCLACCGGCANSRAGIAIHGLIHCEDVVI